MPCSSSSIEEDCSYDIPFHRMDAGKHLKNQDAEKIKGNLDPSQCDYNLWSHNKILVNSGYDCSFIVSKCIKPKQSNSKDSAQFLLKVQTN